MGPGSGEYPHLLVGDPGIAKSQLLRYMTKISPSGIYTRAKVPHPRPTATAVKDELGDGRWTIEAGALVLADNGIAAVDEWTDGQRGQERAARGDGAANDKRRQAGSWPP